MQYVSILMELTWRVGGLSIMIIVVSMLLWETGRGWTWRVSLFNKETRRQLVKMYRDPKIKFGGPLGVIKKLLIVGFTLIGISLILRLFLFVVEWF